MLDFIVKRLILLVPLLFFISVVSFVVIVLPPGNFVDSYARAMQNQGYSLSDSDIQMLYRQYGLDRSIFEQYVAWMGNLLTRGDFGRSFVYNQPVSQIILSRLPASISLSLMALAVTWLVAIPIGIISALRQHSAFDYAFTAMAFVGLALPNFLLALVIAYIVFVTSGHAITSLFSPEFARAPWSLAKVQDLLSNVWLPIAVIGVAGTAGLIRILRATLLDEKNKQYVITARAKGLSEPRLILKYPVRVAINPLISTIGWTLPYILSGEIIVSKVLNLDTLGPVLLTAALSEDMYLVGSIVLILSTLTVIGTLLSDILLAVVDPRIRMGQGSGA